MQRVIFTQKVIDVKGARECKVRSNMQIKQFEASIIGRYFSISKTRASAHRTETLSIARRANLSDSFRIRETEFVVARAVPAMTVTGVVLFVAISAEAAAAGNTRGLEAQQD